LGRARGPHWLDTAGLHAYLLGRDVDGVADVQEAVRLYAEWVASAPDQRLWDDALRQQIYLGDDAFVEQMQALSEARRKRSIEVPSRQRSSPKTLTQWLAVSPTRDEALRRGHVESGLTMSDMARELNISVSRVSKLIRRAMARLDG